MNINKLMPKDALNQRKVEIQASTARWERTGLLEGLNESDKGNVAVMLDNQAKQILFESNATSTVAGSEEWAGVALPLVRRVFGDIKAKDFVSVQPLDRPSGLVFWMEFKYGTGQPGFSTNAGHRSQRDSLFGITDASKGDGDSIATGGFYGAGRFGYSINDYSSSTFTVVSNANANNLSNGTGSVEAANLTSDIGFNSEFSGSIVTPSNFKKVIVPVNQLSNPDLLGARAFTLTATGINEVFNQFTTVSADKSTITFFVDGTLTTAADVKVFYHKQPTDITRGDFEDGKTQENPLDIPELNMEFYSETITAKTRKLKTQWTPEFARDINQYQNIDAEAELTAMLGDYIAKEIDLEILDMLRTSAQSLDAWSARIGQEYNKGTKSFVSGATNAMAYTQSTWFQTLGTKIKKQSNHIAQLTQTGGINFMVVSPQVATVLESINGFNSDVQVGKSTFNAGTVKIGTFDNQYQVYKCPYFTDNVILTGYRGSNMLEAGAVYAPHTPLIMTPVVLDPDNFTPRKGVMTSYGKKILRPEYYGLIYVEGLDSI